MTVTIFGFLVGAVGLFLLFRGSIADMLMLILGCELMGASAALILPSLGGSSVPPAQFALVFALARIMLPGSHYIGKAAKAFKATAFLGLFAVYAVATAILGPVLFRGMIWVPAMRGTEPTHTLFDTIPLAPSPQNVTVTFYIIGSFLTGIVAYMAIQEKNAPRRLINMATIMMWIHIGLGLLAVVVRGTPFEVVVSFFRNGSYTMHDQTVDGVARLTGIFTEPSAYAGFAFAWFVFLFECWLRDILPRRTGPASLATGLVLLCSTSSTAYVALIGYGAILGLRTMAMPHYLGAAKGLTIAGTILTALIVFSLLAFTMPSFVDLAFKILSSATLGKQHSDSAIQRGMWAWFGIKAFVMSWGFGIGPGSFRSSSQLTAMLGSVGIFGTAMLVIHLLLAVKPLRISTYCGPTGSGQFGTKAMVGAAAAWAAVGVLLPASIASPTCDPGSDFAIFTAAALALRGPLYRHAASRSRSQINLSIWQIPISFRHHFARIRVRKLPRPSGSNSESV